MFIDFGTQLSSFSIASNSIDLLINKHQLMEKQNIRCILSPKLISQKVNEH